MGTGTVAYASGKECAFVFVRQAEFVFWGVLMNQNTFARNPCSAGNTSADALEVSLPNKFD
jgi:hypothetical protein